MKSNITVLSLLPVILIYLTVALTGRVNAQTFTTLHEFLGGEPDQLSDGAEPLARLLLSGKTLYGTTSVGGVYTSGFAIYFGTIFKVNTDGTGFTNFYTFTGGSDGSTPVSSLIISSNTLYGTTLDGGSHRYGTVFAINTDGTGFTNLYEFGGSDGSGPYGALVLSSNILYGTTYQGGTPASGSGSGPGSGTVFVINTDGTAFTNLYNFARTYGANINSDGAGPQNGVILSGNTLYGTTCHAGPFSHGTVFALNIATMAFTNLHNFTGGDDGATPFCSLILLGSTLYGEAQVGGNGGSGTIFAINTDGSGFTNLYTFTPMVQISGTQTFTNTDGSNPVGALALSGNTLYGSTYYGGNQGDGTVFRINTDGTGFLNLFNFTNGSDGANPEGGVILSNDTLYGTTPDFYFEGAGTAFSLSFRPSLNIAQSSTNMILTWPISLEGFDYSGFSLQSTTNLYSGTWNIVSPNPTIMNEQFTVTNAIYGTQMFYRLSQ